MSWEDKKKALRRLIEFTTPEERIVFLALLAIILVGLTARYFYLKHEEIVYYTPEELKALNIEP